MYNKKSIILNIKSPIKCAPQLGIKVNTVITNLPQKVNILSTLKTLEFIYFIQISTSIFSTPSIYQCHVIKLEL